MSESRPPTDLFPVLPPPAGGRTVTATRRVRWGDVDRGGRLRLDGTARYIQDLGGDDTRGAGADPNFPFVVRRTAIEVIRPAVADEVLHLSTFCGGIGARWAERRTTLLGDRGAHIEAMGLWVCINRTTGRPARLEPDFLDLYADFDGDRKVGASLTHPDPPGLTDGTDNTGVTISRPWPLRDTDFDPLNHMNNAATWEPVVDELARLGVRPGRATLEYRNAIEPGDQVTLISTVSADLVQIWLTVDEAVRASAVVWPRGDRTAT